MKVTSRSVSASNKLARIIQASFLVLSLWSACAETQEFDSLLRGSMTDVSFPTVAQEEDPSSYNIKSEQRNLTTSFVALDRIKIIGSSTACGALLVQRRVMLCTMLSSR